MSNREGGDVRVVARAGHLQILNFQRCVFGKDTSPGSELIVDAIERSPLLPYNIFKIWKKIRPNCSQSFKK